jgi:hypothetical protein
MFMNLEGLVINYLITHKDYTLDEAMIFWKDLCSEIMDALYGTSLMSVDEIIENNLGVTIETLEECA